MAETANGPLIKAAGGILYRDDPEDGLQLAIIHRPRYDDWTLPKGKLSSGETEVEGAVREVYEETGYRTRVGRGLGEIHYLKETGDDVRPKVVRYWAMEATGGGFGATREVDELRWVEADAAAELVSYDRDREVLARFRSAPASTTSVVLLRHASAGSRGKWEGDDRRRPLDELGWEQAEDLVRLFSRFDVTRIVSADFVRCEQTVQPFSEAVGAAVERDPLFSERGYPGHEMQAVNALRDYGQSGVHTVVCSQGDVIPDLLARLSDEDHVDLGDQRNGKKGSAWVLSFDRKHLVSGEHFSPPANSSSLS